MVKIEGLSEIEIKRRKLEEMTTDFLESKTPFKIIFKNSLDDYGDLPQIEDLGFGSAEKWYFSQALPKVVGKFQFYVVLKGCAIYVDSLKNRIHTVSPIIFNDVVALAEAYEKAGFGEFTVKKQYGE